MKETLFIDRAKLPYLQRQHIDYTIVRSWKNSESVEIEIEVNSYNLSNLIYAGVHYGLDLQSLNKVA